MTITETVLLDNYVGYGLDMISDCPSSTGTTRIWWNYHKGADADGYQPVCNPRDAGFIFLKADRRGTQIALDASHDTHPNLSRIQRDLAEAYGNEI